MNTKRVIEVLDMIADDMKNDAKKFDGQPFTGRTVAEYFGNQGAAIASLARIIKADIQSRDAELPDAPACGDGQDDTQDDKATTDV